MCEKEERRSMVQMKGRMRNKRRTKWEGEKRAKEITYRKRGICGK